MTNNRIILKALSAALLACSAGFAAAADTQNLTVTATVSAVCKFTSTAQTLNFGTLDPSVGGNAVGSGATVQYKCTKGTSPTSVAVGTGIRGNNTMLNTANTDTIAYSLTAAGGGAGNGFGSGAALTVGLTSQVLAADYLTKSAGTYNDTVVLTLNF